MFKEIQQIQTIKQNERCSSVNFNNSEQYNFLACSEGVYLKIYNIEDINNFNSKDGVNTTNLITARDTIIQSKFSKDGKKLVISDLSNCIQCFCLEKNFFEISKIEPGALKNWKFEISPNNNMLATGCTKFMLYDIDSGEKIYEIDNDNKYIHSMVYLNENTIILGNTNGSIYIFNTETRKKTLSLKDNCMTIRSLCHDEINNRLLSASDDLHINIYDTKDFRISFPLVGHKFEISNVIYNPSRNIYLSSSFDGTLKVWDAKLSSKNNLIQTLNLNSLSSITQNILVENPPKDENNIIWDISFSDDGKYLMAGSEYGLHIFSC